MEAVDQGQFNFSPTSGLAVGVMVGFLVFAVARDLTAIPRIARGKSLGGEWSSHRRT